MRVVVRAFTSDGYHRDILLMDEEQVRCHDTRLENATSSCLTGLLGVGMRITPEDFPEVSHFEVVIKNGKYLMPVSLMVEPLFCNQEARDRYSHGHLRGTKQHSV